MKLFELKDEIHADVLAMRKVEYIINTNDFARLWENSPLTVRRSLRLTCRSGHYVMLRRRIEEWKRMNPDLESMTLVQLKIEAQKRGVPYNMPKDELLGVLLDAQ